MTCVPWRTVSTWWRWTPSTTKPVAPQRVQAGVRPLTTRPCRTATSTAVAAMSGHPLHSAQALLTRYRLHTYVNRSIYTCLFPPLYSALTVLFSALVKIAARPICPQVCTWPVARVAQTACWRRMACTCCPMHTAPRRLRRLIAKCCPNVR